MATSAECRKTLNRTLARLRAGSSAPPDVPSGHLAVCVGARSRRFVVRTTYLNHPVFQELLAKAEEVYGFGPAAGPLMIPCDESHFEEVLSRVSADRAWARRRQ